MTRTQVYIQPELLAQAKITAKNRGINLSQFIRQSVEYGIKTEPKKHKTLADLKSFTMDNPIEYKESWELSKKIDEIVYDL
jgi:hypothetical protein